MGPDLEPTIKTIIYATPRVECPELLRVKEQLVARYGKQVEQTDGVDPRLQVKLSVRNPDPFLVNRYLEMIAASYEVDWKAPPVGNLLPEDQPPPPYMATPLMPTPTPPTLQPAAQPAPADAAAAAAGVPDFAELTRRFEELKQQKK